MKKGIDLYKPIGLIFDGSEVQPLKILRQLPAELAEKLEIPEEVLPGTGSLWLSGGRYALLEAYRGIIEYSGERIVLALGRGKITLSGSGMKLRAMNVDQLLVSGRIDTVEWG